MFKLINLIIRKKINFQTEKMAKFYKGMFGVKDFGWSVLEENVFLGLSTYFWYIFEILKILKY